MAMVPEWVDLNDEDNRGFTYAMNVPGGLVLRYRCDNNDALTFVPFVQVTKENGKVGFVSIMAETSIAAAMSAVGIMDVLDKKGGAGG
jgi:hypothetical protein